MNGKIEAFLEIAINVVKEHFLTDERERIYKMAEKIKDEIIEELNRNDSLDRLLKITGISFKKEAYNVEEWFKMAVKEIRDEIGADLLGLSKTPNIDEFKNGQGTIVWGYANLEHYN